MKDQVLSIEQMHKLYDLSIDISNASMCWTKDPEGKRMIELHDEFCYEMSYLDPIPTFTLQDIFNLLPDGFRIIKGYINGEEYWICNVIDNPNIHVNADGNTALEAAYNMLCWLAENKLLE